jgi:HlyD family secretion protein
MTEPHILPHIVSPVGPGSLALAIDDGTTTRIDNGLFEKRLGWCAIALFFGLFLFWSAFIRLDAAATASGVIAVSGSRQVIQHKDGGNVAAVYVKEGQHVQRGQLLIQLAGGDTEAVARSLEAQEIALQAQMARLAAERLGSDLIVPPEFSELRGDQAAEAQRALAMQRTELATRRRQLSDQRLVLRQQADQMGARIGGLQNQIKSNGIQGSLLDDQLTGLKDLSKKGFASVNRVRELERTAAALDGDTSRLSATVAETREQIGETQKQALSLESQRQQDISEELRTTSFTLNDLIPKLAAAKDAFNKTQIRAPVTGQVVGLQVFSVGSVITPGQKVLEIVPSKAILVIDAKVSPNDADDLYVGQKTEVRVTALHDRGLPVLVGTLSRLSADSFEDQRTGAQFFTAEVTVGEKEFSKLDQLGGGPERIKPGLPVEILVPLRKRTLLQYILEPLDQVLWRSMREH